MGVSGSLIAGSSSVARAVVVRGELEELGWGLVLHCQDPVGP
jgi:hypothetical protein